MSVENLKVGARGWHHPHWCGTYYPDDLPTDWQLSFYANEFSVVLVPADYWNRKSGYEYEEWIDAVDEGFRFYLECPALENDGEQQRFVQQCTEMDRFLGGIVIDGQTVEIINNLPCPIVETPACNSEALHLAVLGTDLDELRKVRVWLESFESQSNALDKVVIVAAGENQSTPITSILKIKALAEMMGL